MEEENFEEMEENDEGGNEGKMVIQRGAVQEEAEIQGFHHFIR